MAPYAMHTHLSWAITEGPLEASMGMLRDAGYQGYWGIEHHSGHGVRAVLDRWRAAL